MDQRFISYLRALRHIEVLYLKFWRWPVEEKAAISQIFDTGVSDTLTVCEAQLAQVQAILGDVEDAKVSDQLALFQVDYLEENAGLTDVKYAGVVDVGAVAEVDELEIEIVVDGVEEIEANVGLFWFFDAVVFFLGLVDYDVGELETAG